MHTKYRPHRRPGDKNEPNSALAVANAPGRNEPNFGYFLYSPFSFYSPYRTNSSAFRNSGSNSVPAPAARAFRTAVSAAAR